MGNLKLAFFLAYKSIVKGYRWALVAIIIVMSLSFINLIFTSSILSGVTDTIDEQMVNTLFANVVISPEESEYYLDHVHQVENEVRQVPGVVGVAPRLNTSAFIEYQWQAKDLPSDKGKSGTWQVIGVDPEQEINVTTINESIMAGSYLEAGDRDKIILGVDIAGGSPAQNASFLTLGGVSVGDQVRLTYPNGIQREYEVKGIFRARSMTADQMAFVTRDEVASVLGWRVFADRASQVLVRVNGTGSETDFIREFKTLGIKGEVRPWQEYGGGTLGVVSSFDVIASLISGIGLVVAAIVMFIVIYINVLNKKRQIGILRAIGIGGRMVIGSYLIQALFYAISGIIIGWLLIHYVIVPHYTQHPLDLPLGLVSLAVEPATLQKSILGIILAAVLAGFIPSRSITRQSIIKVVWGA